MNDLFQMLKDGLSWQETIVLPIFLAAIVFTVWIITNGIVRIVLGLFSTLEKFGEAIYESLKLFIKPKKDTDVN